MTYSAQTSNHFVSEVLIVLVYHFTNTIMDRQLNLMLK